MRKIPFYKDVKVLILFLLLLTVFLVLLTFNLKVISLSPEVTPKCIISSSSNGNSCPSSDALQQLPCIHYTGQIGTCLYSP